MRVQPIWHSWVPLRGARQVLSMLTMLDAQSANDGRRISVLLQELAGHGYHRNVIRYWNANRAALWANVDIWGQVGYCILGLGRKGEARKHFFRVEATARRADVDGYKLRVELCAVGT